MNCSWSIYFKGAPLFLKYTDQGVGVQVSRDRSHVSSCWFHHQDAKTSYGEKVAHCLTSGTWIRPLCGGETTVSRIRKRTISICTTGHAKGKFLVILAAITDGRKGKLYVVLEGVHPVAALTVTSGVVVAFSKNRLKNEALPKPQQTSSIGCLTTTF